MVGDEIAWKQIEKHEIGLCLSSVEKSICERWTLRLDHPTPPLNVHIILSIYKQQTTKFSITELQHVAKIWL